MCEYICKQSDEPKKAVETLNGGDGKRQCIKHTNIEANAM